MQDQNEMPLFTRLISIMIIQRSKRKKELNPATNNGNSSMQAFLTRR